MGQPVGGGKSGKDGKDLEQGQGGLGDAPTVVGRPTLTGADAVGVPQQGHIILPPQQQPYVMVQQQQQQQPTTYVGDGFDQRDA